MDVGEIIKFRVIDEEFTESEPTGPPDEASGKNTATKQPQTTDHNSKPPYRIVGAINEPGLGIDSWWTQQNEAGEDEEEEDDE